MKKILKKIGYWAAVITACLIANLNPIQAARVVPGTVPDKVPLQQLPPGVQPNYSGGIGNTQTPEANGESSAQLEQSADQNGAAADSGSVYSTPTQPNSINGGTLWAIYLVAIAISAGLAYAWYRFRSRRQKPANTEVESKFTFEK